MSDPFVEYYEKKASDPQMLARFQRVMDTVLRIRTEKGLPVEKLSVLDIGCNAGAEAELWARSSHSVHGLDINRELLELARKKAARSGLAIDYRLGTAEELPWDSGTMDVCLMPELLEHVEDWERCLEEGARVLRPGGTLFLSTTNYLCPRQEEFDLPLYSWYPGPLKRYCEKLAVTTRPQWVQHAEFPAIHWFSPYQLSRFLQSRGFEVLDRFDAMDPSSRSTAARATIRAIRGNGLLRLLGHIGSSATRLIALKRTDA